VVLLPGVFGREVYLMLNIDVGVCSEVVSPVVRFLDNWTVKVELIEERQASNHPGASP